LTIQVGVIGLGVGEAHIAGYLQCPECRVVALCDLQEERLTAVGERYHVSTLTTDAQAVLSDSGIHLVSIASYDDVHFEQAREALRHGKHVFVEKPMCRSVEQLRELKETMLEHPHARLASNLVLRSAPVYRWVRSLILDGSLGEIYAIDGDYLYGRLEKITNGWRKDVSDYSVMLGGGVHLVDLMLWLTGQRPAEVTAVGNRISSSESQFKYHDYVSATYSFPSGLVGRVTANFGCVHRHQHVLRVFGTRGTFLYDDQGPRFHGSRDASLTASMVNLSALPASKAELIPYFVEGILSGRIMHDEMQHEFNVISACVAADQALEAACAVEVAYV